MNLSATNNTRLLNDIRYVTTKLTKIERQVAKCGRILQVISSNEKAYFIDKDRNLKLIRGEYPFNSMASRVKMVIMSSGTPTTSLICRNYSRVESIHPIPKKNRLIYYEPIGKMSRSNIDNTVPNIGAAYIGDTQGIPETNHSALPLIWHCTKIEGQHEASKGSTANPRTSRRCTAAIHEIQGMYFPISELR